MERRAHSLSVTRESLAPLSRSEIGGRSAPLASTLERELQEGSAAQRCRAVTRLEAVLGLEASPHLREALASEEDPAVLAALCASLGRLGESEALEALRPHRASEDPGVRSAALEASLRLAPSEDERLAWIEEGLSDPCGSVRRRTFLAAAAAPGVELAPWAIRFRRDDDPHLRRLAYVALATSPDPSLAAMALDALLDPDPGVRMAAGAALERWFGDDLPALEGRSPLELRREIAALKSRLASGSAAPRPPAPSRRRPRPGGGAAPARAQSGRPAAEPPAGALAFEAIERVLLAAIRGMHLGDLAAELGEDEAVVGAAVQQHLVEGRLVLRGTKLYLP